MNVVNSFNEWDPLEEVVCGIVEGACYSPWHPLQEACTHEEYVEPLKQIHTELGGLPRPDALLAAARQEVDEFVHVLKAEGVTVVRPDPVNQALSYGTLDWHCAGGNSQANPRDVMTVIGNEIIEAPMAKRSRFFEYTAYRTLIKNYFRQGAKWTAAPKPRMSDELYDPHWKRGTQSYLTTEFEPVWDAADITRCGRDIFFQRSQVSNRFATEWLQRHLGDAYRVHLVEFADDDAEHIDTTMVFLCPGKVLMNPIRPIRNSPDLFRKSGWELLEPAPSVHTENKAFAWYHLNLLMLDEQRVIVERDEQPFIAQLKNWGFKPIPIAFQSANRVFSGGFHCFTCDIRRRGSLQSYF